MASKINWCEEVLEVTGGCTKCSPGCDNCWAIRNVWRMAHKESLAEQWGGLVEKKNGVLNWTGKIKLFPEALKSKKLRGKGKRIFIDSKCDLFHKDVPDNYIIKVLDACILKHRQHQLYFLTKRVERMADVIDRYYDNFNSIEWLLEEYNHIHFGATICNQAEADEKIPILLQIPAAHRWVSFEPLMEDIWLNPIHFHYKGGIGFAVIGCEKINNKPGRPCKREWIESIYEQCKAAGVEVMVKQMEIHGKVCHDPAECERMLNDSC